MEKKRSLDMTVGTPWRLLLRFALPLLAGNMLQQCYNIIDSLVVGRILGKDALAAVGTTYPIFFLFASLFMGIGLGTTVLIAQFYGAKEKDKVQIVVDTAYRTFIVVALLLTVGGQFVTEPLLRLMEVPGEALVLSTSYLRIIFLGSLATFGYNINAGILQGLGDTVSSLKYLSVAMISNIILDVLFVGPCGMGVNGAAWATIIAQTFSFVFGIWHINRGKGWIRIRLKGSGFDAGLLRECVRLGLPAGLQSVFFSVGMLALQRLVNSYGTAFMAGFNAANKIDSLAFLPMTSFASAMTTYFGQNYGAKAFHRLSRGLNAGMALTLISSLILLPLVVWTGPWAIRLFLDHADQEVIAGGMAYLWRVEPFMALLGILFIYNGALRGLGQSIVPMLASLLSLWIGRLPFAYYLAAHYGRDALFYSYVIGWVLGLALSVGYFYFGRWRQRLQGEMENLAREVEADGRIS